MKTLPTLRQLRQFVALAEQRHFARAAAACHVTQSTLSASLKELEAILGAVLVDRTKRRVALTPLGEEMAMRARTLLRQAEDMVAAAEAVQEPLTGTIRMGVIPTIGPFLLPRVLPALRRAYPKLRLYLTEDLTDRLVEQLHAGAIDVALVARPWDCGAVETAEVDRDEFVFACRADAPEARAKAIAPEQISPERLLLLQDGHCLRDHALAACRLATSRHLDTFKASSLHTLVQMADNGLGTTLLPRLAIEAGILRGTKLVARPFRPPQPYRRIALIWRRGTGRREEFERLAVEIARLARVRLGKYADARAANHGHRTPAPDGSVRTTPRALNARRR